MIANLSIRRLRRVPIASILFLAIFLLFILVPLYYGDDIDQTER